MTVALADRTLHISPRRMPERVGPSGRSEGADPDRPG
jgi:hypothetical protein